MALSPRWITGEDAIPILSFADGLGVTLAVTTSTARVALPATQVVTLAATVDCHVRLGDADVTAGTADAAWSGFIPAGGWADIPVRGGETHVAAIAGEAGSLLVMGRS